MIEIKSDSKSTKTPQELFSKIKESLYYMRDNNMDYFLFRAYQEVVKIINDIDLKIPPKPKPLRSVAWLMANRAQGEMFCDGEKCIL